MFRPLSIVVCTLLVTFGCAGGSAGGSGPERPSYSLTKKFGEMMRKVTELSSEKKWDATLAEIDRVAEHKNLNPYERAVLWNARAGVHFQLNQIEETTKDLEQAVALDAMPEKEQLDAEYNLGQAYFTDEHFAEAADTFAKWAKHTSKAEPSQYYVIASAYAQAKRFADALPFAQKAVSGMGEPKEPWLQLLVSLHFELHQEAEVASTLERMLKAFPKKDYYLQLAASYQEQKQDGKAVATLESAQAKGLLDEEKDFVSLAQFYLRAGAPAKGAALLDKQLKAGKVKRSAQSLELLALCYVKAKDPEHAAAALEEGGADAGSGDTYFELARLEAQKAEWVKARDALVRALQKGELSAPGAAHLLLGVVHYNTKRKDAALSSLNEAKRYPDSAKCADEWLQRVKSGKTSQDLGCALGH